jgi:hypothetical protein
MKHLFLIAFLNITLMIMFVTAAVAAPVSTWSGAGPNACHGRCPQDWAETHLTPEELPELNTIRSTQPDPRIIMVNDGDVFSLVTYFKDGEPVAYRTTTVAVLPESTTAMGWQMDGWAWVKLTDCSNWTIVTTQNIGPLFPNESYMTPKTPLWVIYEPPTITPWFPPTVPPTEVYIPPTEPTETPLSPVPLSPSGWFLIIALGVLATFRGKMKT